MVTWIVAIPPVDITEPEPPQFTSAAANIVSAAMLPSQSNAGRVFWLFRGKWFMAGLQTEFQQIKAGDASAGDALGANSRGISGTRQASYPPQTETPSRTLGSVSVIVGGPPSSTEVQPQDRGLLDALVANRLIARR